MKETVAHMKFKCGDLIKFPSCRQMRNEMTVSTDEEGRDPIEEH